jgi:uncharacterized surface protein with fasciclin (FAS1) repeats
MYGMPNTTININVLPFLPPMPPNQLPLGLNDKDGSARLLFGDYSAVPDDSLCACNQNSTHQMYAPVNYNSAANSMPSYSPVNYNSGANSMSTYSPVNYNSGANSTPMYSPVNYNSGANSMPMYSPVNYNSGANSMPMYSPVNYNSGANSMPMYSPSYNVGTGSSSNSGTNNWPYSNSNSNLGTGSSAMGSTGSQRQQLVQQLMQLLQRLMGKSDQGLGLDQAFPGQWGPNGPYGGGSWSNPFYPPIQNSGDLLSRTGVFPTLGNLLQRGGLQSTVGNLEQQAPLIIFAPTEQAFKRLAEKDPALFHKLQDPRNVNILNEILKYHVSQASRSGFRFPVQNRDIDSLTTSTDGIKYSGNAYRGNIQNSSQLVTTGRALKLPNNTLIIPIDDVLIPPGLDLTRLV